MLVQGNDKFEKRLSIGREHKTMRRLGSNSNVNHTFSTQKTKNVFVKAMSKANAQASHKGKVKVSSQEPSQRSYEVGVSHLVMKTLPGKGTIEALGMPTLTNVLIMKGLKNNLIHISQIYDKGYGMYIEKDMCGIMDMDSNEFLIKGLRTSNKGFAMKSIKHELNACNVA